MKKIIAIAFLFISSVMFAQNIQLHYDLGEERDYFTSTIEMFKPDEYGSTFFFVDFDYNRKCNNSIGLSYFEIARYINLPWVKGLAATVQYNDGQVAIYNAKIGATIDAPLGHVVLAGLSYPIDLGVVTLNTDLLYRKDYLVEGNDVQLTTTWFVPFFKGKVSFNGFVDVWTKDKVGEDGKDFVFLTEPQIWYNINKHISVGGEVEISNKFIPFENDLTVNPTLALKWNF